MHSKSETRYPICPKCLANLDTPDSLKVCPSCGLTFSVEPEPDPGPYNIVDTALFKEMISEQPPTTLSPARLKHRQAVTRKLLHVDDYSAVLRKFAALATKDQNLVLTDPEVRGYIDRAIKSQSGTVANKYNKRLVRIAEILEGHSIYGNEWKPEPKPKKYLAVEYSDGDAVWTYGDDSLEELKAAIMMSDTDRDAVKVFDLDTHNVYLPVWTLSHFVEEK